MLAGSLIRAACAQADLGDDVYVEEDRIEVIVGEDCATRRIRDHPQRVNVNLQHGQRSPAYQQRWDAEKRKVGITRTFLRVFSAVT